MSQGEEDNVDDKDELIGIKGDPAIFDFNEKEGMKVDIPKNASPLQIFFLLFDIALIDKLVHWTDARTLFLSKMASPENYM